MSAVPRRIGLLAPLSGILVPLERVPDPVFAQRTVGDGVSIDPTSCDVLAPAAGLVTLLHRAAHALAITTDQGVEVLVHIGVDTVSLDGKGFTARVSQGDRVAAGQPLISFDADLIARSAPSLLTQVLVTNRERIRGMTVATGLVDAGRSVILDVELAAAAPVEAHRRPRQPPSRRTSACLTARGCMPGRRRSSRPRPRRSVRTSVCCAAPTPPMPSRSHPSCCLPPTRTTRSA